MIRFHFADVKKELATLEKSFNFGATLDLDLLGIEINDETLIPGLAVASSRAQQQMRFMVPVWEQENKWTWPAEGIIKTIWSGVL